MKAWGVCSNYLCCNEQFCPTDELDDILKEAQLLLDGSGREQKQGESWKKRMESLTCNWQSSRQQLFEALLSSLSVTCHTCDKCLSMNATVRCKQCTYQHLCQTCDDDAHEFHPLHDREVFHQGFYKPVAPTVSSDGKRFTTVGQYETALTLSPLG